MEGALAETDTTSSVLYSSLSVDGQRKAGEGERRAEEVLHSSETATPVADQLYAQVDKKRKKTGASSDPHTSRGRPTSGPALRSSGQEEEEKRSSHVRG